MTEPINTMGDFYGEGDDRLINALERWDYDAYLPLQARDPELYRLLCEQAGFPLDILLGQGCVKLGLRHRQITLTWNGDSEDLLELVLEGARLIGPPS